MLDENKYHPIELCLNSSMKGNVISFIHINDETGEQQSFQRITLGPKRICFFRCDDKDVLRKVKLEDGIPALFEEIRNAEKSGGRFSVRANGIPVKGSAINALNYIKNLIAERQQLGKSKWVTKNRRKKVLAGQLLELIEAVEESGKRITDKDIIKKTLEGLKTTEVEQSKEEVEKDAVQDMLTKRFQEKRLISEGKAFDEITKESETKVV